MRLTMYTDYALRVLIYLTLKYESGEKSTIPEMATAYGISRNHLMKIVHELSQHGIIETARGRAGGAWLARAPNAISVGEIVRIAEPDFALVECHEEGKELNCVVSQACNLKRGFRRALDAFMQELDGLTMKDAVSSSSVAAALLNLNTGEERVVSFVPRALARSVPPKKKAKSVRLSVPRERLRAGLNSRRQKAQA